MSYHEGSNWQARKEDEGKPLYDSLSKDDMAQAVQTAHKMCRDYEKYCKELEVKLTAEAERSQKLVAELVIAIDNRIDGQIRLSDTQRLIKALAEYNKTEIKKV